MRTRLEPSCECADAGGMQPFGGDQPVRGLSPSLVGLVLGVCAALPMYLWQGNPQIAAACFIIVGYTACLWTHAHNHGVMEGLRSAELRLLPVNRVERRVIRMLLDPGFWWTVMFGCAIVTGSVWYAGLRDTLVVAGVGGVWAIIAIALSYGLTVIHPVTRCRRCGHDLSGQLAADASQRTITCPECGAKWSRAQLGDAPVVVDWRKAA